LNGWWWNWNSASGQFGYTAVERAFGSVQLGPSPFVQPGPPITPAAFDQPPEYQAQLTPLALSSSPMFVFVSGGRRLASAVPGEYGWYHGCVVLTA
jgi:hypothetical protein